MLDNCNVQKIVGNYLLGDVLGEGTFGKVRLAIHFPSGEEVAVKILEKRRMADAADIGQAKREIKILKKFRHRNVVQLFEVVDTQSSLFLVMEYTPEGELFNYIASRKRLEEKEACFFFHQIVNGVEELHKLEVTHRDLKLENLLLKNTPQGLVVKIADFGLSDTHDNGKLLTTPCGSPCYAAPEIIAGNAYVGPVADIWSLGVTLFSIVAGFLPFEDSNPSNPNNLYKKIMAGDFRFPTFLSLEVKDLLRKILDTNPRRRYSLDQIRQHPWYQQISESLMPREVVSLEESIQIHADILCVMEETGTPKQRVVDALQNNKFNEITANYYLLEQKFQRTLAARKAKMPSIAARGRSFSNGSAPGLGPLANTPRKVRSTKEMEAAISCCEVIASSSVTSLKKEDVKTGRSRRELKQLALNAALVKCSARTAILSGGAVAPISAGEAVDRAPFGVESLLYLEKRGNDTGGRVSVFIDQKEPTTPMESITSRVGVISVDGRDSNGLETRPTLALPYINDSQRSNGFSRAKAFHDAICAKLLCLKCPQNEVKLMTTSLQKTVILNRRPYTLPNQLEPEPPTILYAVASDIVHVPMPVGIRPPPGILSILKQKYSQLMSHENALKENKSIAGTATADILLNSEPLIPKQPSSPAPSNARPGFRHQRLRILILT